MPFPLLLDWEWLAYFFDQALILKGIFEFLGKCFSWGIRSAWIHMDQGLRVMQPLLAAALEPPSSLWLGRWLDAGQNPLNPEMILFISHVCARKWLVTLLLWVWMSLLRDHHTFALKTALRASAVKSEWWMNIEISQYPITAVGWSTLADNQPIIYCRE